MVVMTGSGDELLFLDGFSSVKIKQFEHDYVVSAYPQDSSQIPRTLGRYYHYDIAKKEVEGLYIAMSKGSPVYGMSSNLFDKEEFQIHDSRTKRRGGS